MIYDADLFDGDRMGRLLRRFVATIEAMVRDPSARALAVPLLLDEERPVLPDPTAPLAAREHEPVTRSFEAQVRAHPARLAVSDATRTWTYEELGARSARLARALVARGVRPGEVVAIYAERNALTVLAMLGILQAGAAFMLLDAEYPAARLAEHLRAVSVSAWVSAARRPAPDELAALVPPPDRRVELDGADAWGDGAGALPVPRASDRAYVLFTSGTSGGPKANELGALYSAFAKGEAANLPDLPLQYGDYAAWQRSRADDAHVQHWVDVLRDAPRTLALPTDRPRRAGGAPRGAALPVELTTELSAAVRELALAERVTPFMVLISAWATALAQSSGQHEVVVGTPVANRTRVELEPLIGCFVNPLPIRVDLRNGPGFRALLGRVKAATLDAFEHQTTAFERIVAAVSPPRDLTHPIFQTMFVLRNVPRTRFRFGGLDVTFDGGEVRGAQLDLLMTLGEVDGRFTGDLLYDSDLFDRETVERLVQSFTASLEAALANPDERLALPERAKRRMVVASTFTGEPVREPLEFWAKELGVDLTLEFAPFGQVFQELLDPRSAVARNVGGVNVLLLRLEDWPPSEVESAARELAAAVQSRAAEGKASFVIVLCPSRSTDPALARAEGTLVEVLGGCRGAHVVPSDWARRYGVTEPFDPHAERLGAVPYTAEAFAALGTTLARALHGLVGAPFKVVAVDADETLWRGVVGEDGVMGVELGPSQRALQERLVALHETGIQVCVVSKNQEEDVRAVFEQRRSEMPLKSEHITAFRVNWEPKSGNLRSLSEALGLSLDAFVFLDDSPMERAEVSSACPEVCVVPLPAGGEGLVSVLEHVWAFDRVRATTAEDRTRAAHYQKEAEREQVRSGAASLGDFLASLRLEVTVRDMTRADVERVSQLTQRTNQFNTTTLRRTEQDVLRDSAPDGPLRVLVTHVRDRFGDYGLVGVVMFRAQGSRLWVESMMLSCRALGRAVEHTIVARLGELAEAEGLEGLDFPFAATARNEPARSFLEAIAESTRREGAWRVHSVSTSRARAAVEDAHAGRAQEEEGGATVAAAPPKANLQHARRLRALARALDLRTAASLLTAIRAGSPRARRAAQGYVPPRGATERALAKIWCDVLAVDRVGRDDDFFALGGDSLQAVRMLGRVSAHFGVDIPLRAIFEAPTVAQLAERVLVRDTGASSARVERVSDRRRAPLSYNQRMWWRRQHAEPHLPRFTVVEAVRLEGELDEGAFSTAVDEVLRRHDILRVSFERGDAAEPVQVVGEASEGALQRIDCADAPADALERYVREQHEHRYGSLEGVAPFHVALLRFAADDHVLVFRAHRAIVDPHMFGPLLRELLALYESTRRGEGGPPPASDIQYVDFVAWQRERLATPESRARIEGARRRLEGASPIALPYDRPNPTHRTTTTHWAPVAMDDAVWKAIAALAQSESTTPFVIQLSLLNAYLAQLTGQDDTVIIAPNRLTRDLDPALADVVGCFVDYFIMRTRMAPASTFRELVRLEHQVVIEAQRDVDLPCILVADEHIDGPLWRVVLNAIPAAGGARPQLPEGISLSGVPRPLHRMVDLAWAVFGTQGTLVADADKFDRETAERLARGLSESNERLLASPDEPLARTGKSSA